MEDANATMEVITKEAKRICHGDANIDADDVAGEAVLRWVEMGMPDISQVRLRLMVRDAAGNQRARNIQQAYPPAYTPASVRAILKRYPPPEMRPDIRRCIGQLRPVDSELIVSSYSGATPAWHSAEEKALHRAIDRLTARMNMHGYGIRRKAKRNATAMAEIEDSYEK